MTSFTVESWLWYGFTMTMVTMRFTSRIWHFRSPFRLQVEDYLMLFLACLYTILIAFLNIDATVSTNLIAPNDIPNLTPEDIRQRTWGSKTVLLVESCMCAVQWGTKACLLLLYYRLTQDLKQGLLVKIAAAYCAVTYIVMEILYFGYWCRPFHDYWQTPTMNVQCTTALHHLIMNLAFNLSSDILVMSIPLPLFMKLHLPTRKKLLLVLPFSMGFFTIVCAILSKHLSFTQPFSGYWVFWYCRESSTAMIVSNMPYAWALIRRTFHLESFFGRSSTEVDRGDTRSTPGLSRYLTSEAHHRTADQKASFAATSPEMQLGSRSGEGQTKHMAGSWGEGVMHDETDFGALSSTGTSVGAGISTTADAVDKLYPLDVDDDEIELVERKRHRYAPS